MEYNIVPSKDEDDEKTKGFGRLSDGLEVYEYCLDVDGDRKNKPRPSIVKGEYGDSSSWKGMYRFAPPREVEDFCFWRGNWATGVRGIIDPLDPDNPYGIKRQQDLKYFDIKKLKETSQMKTAS